MKCIVSPFPIGIIHGIKVDTQVLKNKSEKNENKLFLEEHFKTINAIIKGKRVPPIATIDF